MELSNASLQKSDVSFVHEGTHLCTSHDEFECPPILIKNEDGLPDIDVLDAFRVKQFSARMKCESNKRGVILPPSLYNPSWDNLDDVREPMIQSAKNAGLNLVKKTTNRDLNGKNKTDGEGKHFVLACTYNLISKLKKEKEKSFQTAEQDETEFEVLQPVYDPEHKIHAIINKQSTIRKGPTKGHGKTLSRKSNIDKRNGETPQNGGHRCPFQIRVNLVEGVHWYIPWKNFESIYHHGHLDATRCELQAKANQIDAEARKQIEMASRHFPNGGALQNMSKDATGKKIMNWCVSEMFAVRHMSNTDTFQIQVEMICI